LRTHDFAYKAFEQGGLMDVQRLTGKDTTQAIFVALIVLRVVFLILLAWPPPLWWR
jgi:hypothetical protein